MAPPEILAGASGYAYRPWKGPFYPDDLKDPEMLRFYGERLGTVEINNTFYRMPKRAVLEHWAGEVPEGFRFAIKASRRITHHARLKEVDEPLSFLLRNVEALGDKMGPLLFQLPPHLKADPERLQRFLDLLPEGREVAMEFRHDSWFEPPVVGMLRARRVALCFVERENAEGEDDPLEVPFEATGGFGYLRLRKDDYTDGELTGWLDRIRAQPWTTAYVYFKHEDEGAAPKLALRLMGLAA
jgi:uncharacterized protein YecE (DUF72 family)